MKSLKIVYLGEDRSVSTSYHRAAALIRLGHEVTIYNPFKVAEKNLQSFWGVLHYRTGYFFLQSKIKKWAREIVAKEKGADLIWVNSGELIGKESMKILKGLGVPVILYNNDDPTGGRDGNRFASLLKSIPFYDLCIVRRVPNVQEYKNRGAKNVLLVLMSYDEVVHQPFEQDSQIPEKFRSDVAFIGTWMRHEKRDEFLLHLINSGLNVSIWGARWQKSPHWGKLKSYYRGGALGGRDYVAAIQGSKVCIGLLSKGNRDLHTRRSVEIPFIGGVFCAERTEEHTMMYKEGVEAVFWDDADECAKRCIELLADSKKREEIRRAGMERVRALSVGNQDICQQGIDALVNRQLI